jgi:hypothetical protein
LKTDLVGELSRTRQCSGFIVAGQQYQILPHGSSSELDLTSTGEPKEEGNAANPPQLFIDN